MAMEVCFSTMEITWRDNSLMVVVKGGDGSLKRTEVITKVISRTMWLTGMVNTQTLLDINTRDIGKIIYQMEKGKLNIKIKASTMVNF